MTNCGKFDPLAPAGGRAAQFRAALAILAVLCLLGALFADSPLVPFHHALTTSRTGQAATEAARWLFIGGACLSAAAFVAWRWLHRGIATGVRSIAGWSGRTFWLIVWSLAFGLQLPVLWLQPAALISDSLRYHDAAVALANGQGFQLHGAPTAYHPPGYSAMLALTYRLFGADPRWAWFWGIAATAIILWSTHLLAGRLYGKTIARLATLIAAVYPALVLATGIPMSDLVFAAGLMLVWCVVALRPPYRWLDTAGLGAALALLTLTRSVALGLIAVIPLLWFIRRAEVRKLILHTALLIGVAAACLTPWVLRNHALFGTPVLGTNMGLTLFMGHHAGASGSYDLGAFNLPLPRGLNEAEIDRRYRDAALAFIASHPADALLAAPKKIVQLFVLETSAAQTLLQDRPAWFKYGAYALTQGFYLPLLICFALRIFNLLVPSTRPHGIQWIGLIVAGYFVLLAMLLLGLDRYRLPFLPWMIVEGCVVMAWLGNQKTSTAEPTK